MQAAGPAARRRWHGMIWPVENPVTVGLGGTLPTGTYFYQITAVNAQGETSASAVQSGIADAATSQQMFNLSWTPFPAPSVTGSPRNIGRQRLAADVRGWRRHDEIQRTGAPPSRRC